MLQKGRHTEILINDFSYYPQYFTFWGGKTTSLDTNILLYNQLRKYLIAKNVRIFRYLCILIEDYFSKFLLLPSL